MLIKSSFILLLVVLTSFEAQSQEQKEREEIESILTYFLQKVDQKEVHDQFWSEKLVYTSSDGRRFGKQEILSGFNNQETSELPPTKYHAEDVDIYVFDNTTASLTFKLVATSQLVDSTSIQEYYNSGMLRKESDTWKVVQWQATKKLITY